MGFTVCSSMVEDLLACIVCRVALISISGDESGEMLEVLVVLVVAVVALHVDLALDLAVESPLTSIEKISTTDEGDEFAKAAGSPIRTRTVP